jgi:valyl-tRNA synthetase
MEINSKYNPHITEDKWYQFWMKRGFFSSTPDEREPYTIVIPPPNVTGVLHMGHMLNNTIQDVLIRRARMQGKNACWVPGTDHASIATEAKVVALLKDKGIDKKDLTREEFLAHAWAWKEKYGGIILEQLKKIGASCDWARTRFTMEEDMSAAVIDVFVDLHKKGQIYRGVRMVNWDPVGKTALSDEEVIHREVNSKLYYVKYKIEGTHDFITVATTRPETIMGDTAVCVHPEDERYKHLVGKKCIVPLVNRSVIIIADDYIDMTFGTGALKVTPAHDINDYNLGQKHNLEIIDTLNDDGTLSEAAQYCVGMDRFAARKKIAEDLKAFGLIEKEEDIKNKNGYSERTNAVIEPKLSMQWFLKMDKISQPALNAVLDGEVKLIPDKFINTYKHWMENVRDWCISRQLWWGQRIPAWYNDKNDFVVCKTQTEAEQLFGEQGKSINGLRQDEDVLDTWFSSWLWPISVFDGFKNPDNKDINYYYPTNDLVTAPEILFFWVARMIIAGYEWRGQKPFTNVYLTGIVRDKQGRKMSKSLGNSPDPLDLIAKYGADGVRIGMLLCSPAGNDLMFDESYCEQGRNFANKIWNAFRLVKGWTVSETAKQNDAAQQAILWFQNKWHEQLTIINDNYSKYRMSEALMGSYKLVWDDFCAWYLEAVKPEYKDGVSEPIDALTYRTTIQFLENIVKLLHPFMPFITEEIWHLITERKDRDCCIVAEWPKVESIDSSVIIEFEYAKELVSQVRNLRQQKSLSPKDSLELLEKSNEKKLIAPNNVALIKKLGNISRYELIETKPEGASVFMVTTSECFVPMANLIDVAAETERLQKDIEYNKGFLKSVVAKLSNEKFVSNAKAEVVAAEKKKQEDAEQKLKALEAQLSALK